jgi:hypothetical protein
MEGQQLPGGRVRGVCGVGLLERRTLIGESTHTAVASKVMIEGTIFLYEDDDMLNVGQLGTNRWGWGGRWGWWIVPHSASG